MSWRENWRECPCEYCSWLRAPMGAPRPVETMDSAAYAPFVAPIPEWWPKPIFEQDAESVVQSVPEMMDSLTGHAVRGRRMLMLPAWLPFVQGFVAVFIGYALGRWL